jgi:hypothetical protein
MNRDRILMLLVLLDESCGSREELLHALWAQGTDGTRIELEHHLKVLVLIVVAMEHEGAFEGAEPLADGDGGVTTQHREVAA